MDNHKAVTKAEWEEVHGYFKGDEIKQTLGEFIGSDDAIWEIVSYAGEDVSRSNIDKICANYRIWTKRLAESSGIIINVARRSGHVYIMKEELE